MKVPFLDLRAQNVRLLDALTATVSSVVNGKSLILGEEVERFEVNWARYCGRKYAVGVGNAYDAIRLLLAAHKIGPRDEVIVATNTHIATWLAVRSVGATIIPVEPCPMRAVLEEEGVYRAANRRTVAVLATNLYGRRVDVFAIRTALKASLGDNDVPVLLDCAQGHGLRGDDLADGAAFSFYPTKNLGALGDAGAIVTDKGAIAAACYALRHYGARKFNHHYMLGENSRLDELQAAFLNVKLPLLDAMNTRRTEIAGRYEKEFDNLGGLVVNKCCGDSVHHQFVVQHPHRDDFRRKLASYGVETLIHYPTPPHLQPAFAYLGYAVGDFPIAEELAARSVSLPIDPMMTDDQVSYVVDTVRRLA